MKQACRIAHALLSLLCLGLLLPSTSQSAARAWLINENRGAVKLDLIQNTVVTTTALPVGTILLDELAVDPVRGNIFVPNGRGPYRVAVFDLKTLKPKGTLDFAVDHALAGSGETIRFIFPATGNVFFARWWNEKADGGNGTFEVVTIDATTFRTIARRTTSPPLSDQLMLDAAGRRLYSMTSSKPAHIDVFTVPNFTKTSSIDLEAFVDPAAFGRDIDDYGMGKVLIGENVKGLRADPNRYSFFAFDVSSGTITPKIPTGLEGSGRLLPRTGRLLLNEQVTLKPGADLLLPGDQTNPGRIHIYNMSTGALLGTVLVSNVSLGEIVGISPAEDVFYYISSAAGSSVRKFSVISLSTYSVLKEFTPLSGGFDFTMIFFDE